MSPVSQVHDINISVTGNCNNCFPCSQKNKQPKPEKKDTDEKIKRVSCVII